MHILPLFSALLMSVVGWLIGRNNPRRKQQQADNKLSKNYFIGLNYLLNEQSDEAIDIFINLLDVDENTIEMHMALGSLFRRKGELNRAIRIHQNIIARPSLTRKLRMSALQELGRDYFAAGVYNRAERLFLEAIETTGEHRKPSMTYLIDIYERQKDWQSALEMAQKLQIVEGETKGAVSAHYYCELIRDPRQNLSIEQSHHYLQLAYEADKKSLRVGMLRAEQCVEEEETEQGISIYKQLIQDSPDFMVELLPKLQRACKQDEKAFFDYLHVLLDTNPQPILIKFIAEEYEQQYGTRAAVDFLLSQLDEYPALSSVEYLVSLQAQLAEGNVKQQAQLVEKYLSQLAINQANYICENCGYSGKNFRWQCPGCRRWSSITPTAE